MHAENMDSAIKRLTQKPMDISPAYIPLMNIMLSVQRVHLIKNNERKALRRIIDVNEIADYEDYRTTYKWSPAKDTYVQSLDKSIMLSKISERTGITTEELIDEIERRRNMLHSMREKNIRSYKDVANMISEYYTKPKEAMEHVLAGEEVKTIAYSRKT